MESEHVIMTDPYVSTMNSYAVFLGYLSMAIKGLGFLILTWTTVVLLGGFVSTLRREDFWCLTFITFVQTAGIFDVHMNEKLSYILHSTIGLIEAPSAVLIKNDTVYGCVALSVRLLLVLVVSGVQMLVLVILLFPLAAIYVFGLLISTGISLWRLIGHDYGINSNEEQANLKPAMDTLYYLALLQGVLFLYRFMYARAGKRVAKDLIPEGGDDVEMETIMAYLNQTRMGCEKNPSFARGMNFITHAVDLIGSMSPRDCFSGIRLLYSAICIQERRLKKHISDRIDTEDILFGWIKFTQQQMLTKKLIMSTSSSPVLQKLLQTLNQRGLDDREKRTKGARIVAYLAHGIHLEEFPRSIHYICNLIKTFEEYRYEQECNRKVSYLLWPEAKPIDMVEHRKTYEKLVLRGLCILRKLAADKNNCRIMSETQGLLPRIMAPLRSDLLHQFHACAWSTRVLEGSLKVLRLLVAAPGETGAMMRREISNNKEAVRTMDRIINCECDYCDVKLQKQAMGILIQIYMDTKSKPTFINILVHIFVADDRWDGSIRKLAGEALAKLCFQSGIHTGLILQVDGDVVGSLTNILLDVNDKTCRVRAAEILEHMCNIHHTQDDECSSKLKNAMTTAMPKVLAEIICYEVAKHETHATAEEDRFKVLVKQDDIENQHKENNTSSSTHPQSKEDDDGSIDVEEDEPETEEDEEFSAPLFSFCVTVYDTFRTVDPELARQFDSISLPTKLREMVEATSDPTARRLTLMKLTCKMVMSMMKHSSSYVEEDVDGLMNALSSASESMHHLDMSMVFASEDDGATMLKPLRSLHSLVIEAKEKTKMRYGNYQESESEYKEPFMPGPWFSDLI